MKKEFMLVIRNESDSFDKLSEEKKPEFLKNCETYIGKLKSEGKLIAAHSLEREGSIISFDNGEWTEKTFKEAMEVQVGYYHILADDMADAIAIAKANPEFAYSPTARIEVRQIKPKEVTTDFVYPTKS
jgi:hypothetical protein